MINHVDDIRSVDDALQLINQALDAAGECVTFGSDRHDAEERAVSAVTLVERAKALAADQVAEADRAGVARRRSSRTMGVVLGHRLSAPSQGLAPYATLGLWLGDFSEFAAAWQRGRVTTAHICLLRSLDNIRTHVLLQRDQDLLLGHAQALSWDDFELTCRYWLLAADPDGELPTERERKYGTTTKTHPNGDVEIRSMYDPLTGEAALTALDHEDQKLYRLTQDDPDANPELLRINSRRRRSLALLNLLTRGFQRADGSFPVPLINIVMSQKVSETLLSSITEPDQSPEFDLAWDDVDRRCETVRGTPIDPRKTRTALLLGLFRRQVVKPDGTPASYTKPQRLFDRHQKQALLVAARGRCEHTGCTNPWVMLTADHKRPNARGGPTSVENGQILCDACNKDKADRLD